MSKNIYLDSPNVGKLEKRYLNKAVDSSYVSTIGPFVPEFEHKFSKYLGAKKAISTQSGTAAIHIALHELNVGKGDEVIVPALTFVATVNPVMYVGATPVFVDVDIKTWNIDPEEIERSITKKTKAIIPTHLYGNPCNMDKILKIARKYNLYVIEDATEALGASYKKRYVGNFGDFGCFSFNGNKVITTGGGGMIVSSDMKRLEHIKFLINQAKSKLQPSYHPEIGFNDRMTNIEAALGLAQMKRLKNFLKKKKMFNTLYRKGLSDIKDLSFQEQYQKAESSHWLTTILFKENINIASLQKELSKKGIATRRPFIPIVEFPPYQRYKKKAYKNSYLVHNRGLCLPSSTLNLASDVRYICSMLRERL